MIATQSPVRRGWTYLQERFPPFAHGPLVFAFAGGVACASAALRGDAGPGWPVVLVAATVALGFFFQLRVADEWKDAERDRLYQPERPVPRGLVTLRELAAAGLAVAAVQVALAAWLDVRLVLVLAAVWAYGALMTVEFGARAWLRERPAATLVSHGLIVPLIDLFAVSCDVLAHDAAVPAGVAPLVGVSLVGGIVVEVGRKIKAPAEERPGVETYSARWGPGRALGVWLGALGLSLACGLAVLAAVGGLGGLMALLAAAAASLAAVAVWAVRDGRPGRHVEAAAGVWTLALYGTIGPLALLVT